MSDLIARLEKATEPHSTLDHAIWVAINPGADAFTYNGDARWKPYTASIDAALTLVRSGAEFEVGSAYLLGVFWATVITPADRYVAKGARSPAIALCIAALKAREAQP